MKKINRALKNPQLIKKPHHKPNTPISTEKKNPTTICYRGKVKAVVEIWTKDKLTASNAN